MVNDRAKALSIDLKEPSSWAAPLIGTSFAIQKVYGNLHTAANNGFPVLLSGETGTGRN